MKLKKHKAKNILLIGDFHRRNKIRDWNANNNSRMGLILDDIINQHGLYITTNTDFTYQQSAMVSNSGKTTIQLTLTRGLKNIKSSNKRLYLNKNKAQSYWNPDWAGTLIQAKSKVQNKKFWLGEMETVSSSTSKRLFYKLPLTNFRKNNRSTGQQIDRANSGFCNKFFWSHRNTE